MHVIFGKTPNCPFEQLAVNGGKVAPLLGHLTGESVRYRPTYVSMSTVEWAAMVVGGLGVYQGPRGRGRR